MAFGAQQVIGWVFKAQDLVTPVVKSLLKNTENFVESFDKGLSKSSKRLKEWHKSGVRFRKTWKGLGPRIVDTQKIMENFGMTAIPAMLKSVSELGDELSQAFKDKKLLLAYSIAIKGIAKGMMSVGKAAKNALVAPVKVMAKLTSKAQTAAVAVGDVLQKHISMEKVLGGISAMGGIGGALMGPLAPLMKLFRPIVDLFVGSFAPAIETFSAIVESAFGPFTKTLEIIAQNLATKLLPFMKKFMVIAEQLALQFGVWITELLDSGFLDKMIDTVVDLAVESLPLVMQVLEEIGTAFKKVGPVMLDAFIEIAKALLPLIPPLTELAVTILKEILVPMLLTMAKVLKEDVVPFIKEWMPALVTVIKDIGAALKEFFGPQFTQYIKPVTDFFDQVSDFVGGAAGKVSDFFSGMFGDDPKVPTGKGLPKRASGTAATNGPVIAGEAGREMIIPLRADTVERVLMPLIPKIAMPGMGEMVGVLQSIDRRLGGTLNVEGGSSAPQQSGPGDLGMSIGMSGVSAW